MQKKEIPIKMDNTNFTWINPKFEKKLPADGVIKFIILQFDTTIVSISWTSISESQQDLYSFVSIHTILFFSRWPVLLKKESVCIYFCVYYNANRIFQKKKNLWFLKITRLSFSFRVFMGEGKTPLLCSAPTTLTRRHSSPSPFSTWTPASSISPVSFDTTARPRSTRTTPSAASATIHPTTSIPPLSTSTSSTTRRSAWLPSTPSPSPANCS